jgi:hypothetical protein
MTDTHPHTHTDTRQKVGIHRGAGGENGQMVEWSITKLSEIDICKKIYKKMKLDSN